jgi:hypothetical protein
VEDEEDLFDQKEEEEVVVVVRGQLEKEEKEEEEQQQQKKDFPRTENLDIDVDLRDEADSDLALEKFNFPETLSTEVPKHPEVQEDEDNEEKNDAGVDSHDETPSNLAFAMLNTTQNVEEENEEKTVTFARSDAQTSSIEKQNSRRRQRCRFPNC